MKDQSGWYVILAGEGRSALIGEGEWLSRPQLYEDTPELKKRFFARCPCEAAHTYRQEIFGEKYDMHFCLEDEKNGDELCPYFGEMKIKCGLTE